MPIQPFGLFDPAGNPLGTPTNPFTMAMTPIGAAGGDLTGTYPNPSLDLTKPHTWASAQSGKFYDAGGLGFNVMHPSYGAKGDGVTDDTLAIRAAITAAGTNGTVIFPGGYTFLHSGELAPLQGQTWIGYGAVLKRANAVSTAFSTTVANGAVAPVLTVTSAAGFFVGQNVSIFNGAVYDSQNHQILSITGNQIQFAGTVSLQGGASLVGGTLYTSLAQINCQVSDVTMLGFELDGNRANNTVFQHWELHNEAHMQGDRSIIRDCYVHDAQSEGIEVFGNSSRADNNFVLNCQGNGIHISGGSQIKITHNWVQNCNLSGTATGHANGCIINSNSALDTVVMGNWCQNGIGGIASWDTDDNSGLTCVGNVIRDCTSFAFSGTMSGVQCGKVIFADNLIYNSVTVALNQTNSGTGPETGPYRHILANNYLENTTITLTRCYHVIVEGNEVWMNNTDTTSLCININDAQGVTLVNNRSRYGANGIYVQSSGGTPRDLDIRGNHVYDAYNNGIYVNAAVGPNVSIRHNTIRSTAGTVAVGHVGISVSNGCIVDSNTLDIQITSPSGAAGILCPNGAASTTAAIVTNNVVRSITGVPSIKNFGGSQNNCITNNFVQQAISNGGGASNTVTGNITIF